MPFGIYWMTKEDKRKKKNDEKNASLVKLFVVFLESAMLSLCHVNWID